MAHEKDFSNILKVYFVFEYIEILGCYPRTIFDIGCLEVLF